jgi:predicted nucleic acid-binding protein
MNCEGRGAVLFDTDVLIWFIRGNERAARIIENEESRHVSVISYMELIQGARSHREMRLLKEFLSDSAMDLLPLTENIGHRAAIYMEEYGLMSGLRLADSLIAATAMENHVSLCTGDDKHFRMIRDLPVKLFQSL